MTINVLFAAHESRWSQYQHPLQTAFEEAGIFGASLARDHAPELVDYIIYAPNSELQDFTPYTRCKAVLNLWAGVETAVGNPTLTQPFCRMADPALTQGMVEWVCGHVLRHHLGMDAHILAKPGEWTPTPPPVSWDRKITVLGLGELGTACAKQLATLGFQTHGWARSAKSVDAVTCHHGPGGLADALADADGVVLLLPKTPATENTLNARTLALMPKGARILNPGRGPLIDDDALLAALDAGQIGQATLDVFRVEPLPADHPYWAHEKVTVTPHIASETRAETASEVIAENIRRGEAGEPFLHLVDRDLGY